MIRLGYAVGSGLPVEIPLRHMVVTGQTQESGKTTTLEALIGRSGLRAVAFVTKRGEGGFADAQRVAPYFREQADWQFVASILEASRGEKLKFERAWIIRASKGARTLADVHRNVRSALEKAKGLSADVYLTLDAYLENVVPQIATVRWASTVALRSGVNAMDLTGLTVEMQHLVIRSTLDWVLTRESDTVVVVPEAWKFIPEGRGTPVKLGAEAFIRQAAALHNFLWLDSQDIGGVDKKILRSVPLWVLGVQREANEIKRTLANIPAGVAKPKAADIATLSLGQFYACWGRNTILTYVQPRWQSDVEAGAVARGELAVAPPRAAPSQTPPEDSMQSDPNVIEQLNKLRETIRRRDDRIAELESQLERLSPSSNVEAAADAPRSGHRDNGDAGSTPAGGSAARLDYEQLRARLLKDPVVLRVLAIKPEIEVAVRTQTVKADGTSWIGFTALLISEGWFNEARTSTLLHSEATRRGMSGIAARAYEACEKLNAFGFLTNEGRGVGYRAVPDMKVNILRERA